MVKASTWFSRAVAAMGILANIPAVFFSLSLLGSWISLHTSHYPYFHYGYFRAALPWFASSTLAISAAAMTMFRRTSNILLPVFSFGVGLVGVIFLPNTGPRFELQEATTKLLGHADHSLSDWDDSHGKFPLDERELREALTARPLQEPAIFYQDGRPIAYDVRVVTNANAPASQPIPTKPGTLVYAISSDGKEYWLTITTLRAPVGGLVVMHRVEGDYQRENIFIMNRKHHNPGDGYQSFIE
jgi:hypothetical protein